LVAVIHNLSDVSTSAVVFLGFRLSRRGPTERYPYGLERAEDLAGIGIALVIWASAAFAGFESVRKLLGHGSTAHVGIGIARAVLGIVGDQIVARDKLGVRRRNPSGALGPHALALVANNVVAGETRAVGRRNGSATLVAASRHSWLDALSSAGALAGLIAV